MDCSPHYSCPICQASLIKQQNSLICANKHQFDYAKEGYVHLLPVQLKKSLMPGDDKNMVLARRAFLELGHYHFLRQHLVNKLVQHNPSCIVDLGCGEGYYTGYIQEQLNESQIYGVDISKAAVKYAAKRNKLVHYSVATNAHTPFADNFADVIVNVFAPLVAKECKRILNEDGCIISVAPGPKHLFELKSHIYDSVQLHDKAAGPDGFYLQHEELIEQTIQLDQIADINNLLLMTPFGWKITEQNKQVLFNNLPISITLSFTINCFKPIIN